MELSNQKPDQTNKLVCLVRSIPVQDTPEERVRQHLLAHLLGPFGCARSLTGVEVALKSLALSSHPLIPRRRVDIVCFSIHKGALAPLLMIECKASRPLPRAINQLNGYNFFVKAPFLAIAWPGAIRVSHHGELLFEGELGRLPTYQKLRSLTLF